MAEPIRVPWDYSRSPADGHGVPNVPTAEGRELGKHLARFADQEADTHPEIPPRCGDCAARLGTGPNGCAVTLMDFAKCAFEGEPFYCHHGLAAGEEPKRLCAGWLLLVGERLPADGEIARWDFVAKAFAGREDE